LSRGFLVTRGGGSGVAGAAIGAVNVCTCASMAVSQAASWV